MGCPWYPRINFHGPSLTAQMLMRDRAAGHRYSAYRWLSHCLATAVEGENAWFAGNLDLENCSDMSGEGARICLYFGCLWRFVGSLGLDAVTDSCLSSKQARVTLRVLEKEPVWGSALWFCNFWNTSVPDVPVSLLVLVVSACLSRTIPSGEAERSGQRVQEEGLWQLNKVDLAVEHIISQYASRCQALGNPYEHMQLKSDSDLQGEKNVAPEEKPKEHKKTKDFRFVNIGFTVIIYI